MSIAEVGRKFTPRPEITSKSGQTAEYKQRKRMGRSEEVVERYKTSLLGRPGTT
jgi:hypothetical protein